MYVIYALIDPRDNTVRYIGITDDVYERFIQHITCGSNNFAKNAWMLGLRAANKMVIMETLEEVETRGLAEEREAYWIKHFEMLKEPVMNVNKTSSARQAKKTNLRVGRSMAISVVNAAVEAMAVSHMRYPDQQEVTVQTKGSGVSDETKNIIKRMHSNGMKMRDIAKLVGLAGEKYGMFQAACMELGLSPKKTEEA